MKKLYFAFILFSIINFASAQTQVSGSQSGTWSSDNSPYEVIGDIIIPSGQTLTIQNGVEVNFQEHYKLTVNGSLQALGNEENFILFTTDNQSTGWGGIRFDNAAGTNHLSFCKIEYGKTSGDYPDNVGGGMALINSTAIITDCIFADNNASGEEDGLGGAVYILNAGASGTITQFINCQFLRNHAYGEGGAIKFTNDINTEITNCQFIENNCLYGGGAISFYTVLDTKITNCLFANNYTTYSNGGAINSLGAGNTISFKNCTIYGNEALGGEGGALSLAYATADFTNCIIYNNPGQYGDDLFLSTFGMADVNYSNLTLPWDATGENNIEEDPLFVDAYNLDFHLQESSPCIDAGIDIGISFVGDAPDMGCYEYGQISDIKNISTYNIDIYPNPTNGEVNFVSDDVQSIEIFDLLGNLVFIAKNTNRIDISSLNSGHYTARVILDNQKTITQNIALIK